jgi:excisionase family DNA binding protein
MLVVGYKVSEAATLLRTSDAKVRDLIARGECPVLRIGRLIRIPPKEFHQIYGDAVPMPPQRERKRRNIAERTEATAAQSTTQT